MFQNIAACRASLAGATRCAHLSRTLGHGCRHPSWNGSCDYLLESSGSATSVQMLAARCYSSQGRRLGFLQQVVDNIRKEYKKDKEMKESLKKFREETQKLEQSDALRMARQKFHSVESETNKSTEVIKEKLEGLKGKMQEVLEEATKSELGKKAGQLGEGISKTARDAAESISETKHAIGKSGTFQRISQTAEAVREELGQHGIQGKVYMPPKQLRKRKDVEIGEDRPIEPNADATGVELHKDSKFYESWQNFKDNNPYVNKVLDWKIKYEESDNPVIRASRALTDRVSEIMGGLFQKTELSQALTEICKLDPSFDKEQFLKDCETDIIPNILEAMVSGNLEILKDWCHEAPFNVISQPIKQAQKLGYRLDSKILDIDNVDLVMGKMMDQGPVLVLNFQSQQIMCVKDSKNKVIEGDPEKVMRVQYVWVLCRDPAELNPKAAWRLLDLSASSTEQLV